MADGLQQTLVDAESTESGGCAMHMSEEGQSGGVAVDAYVADQRA
jgi:hypothetical protein